MFVRIASSVLNFKFYFGLLLTGCYVVLFNSLMACCLQIRVLDTSGVRLSFTKYGSAV